MTIKKPCPRHKAKKRRYVEAILWAEKMIAKGKKQTQCPVCGRWFFKCEM